MAKLVPVGYVDFVLNITRSGDPEPFAVTFGGRIDGGPYTELDTQAVANVIAGRLANQMQPEDSMTGLTAYVTTEGAPLIFEAPMDVVGTDVGEPLPQNVAAIVTKLTGLGGRWNKGRVFWPSLNEELIGFNGEMSPPYRDEMTAAFNGLLEDLTGGLLSANLTELVIFHDESVGVPPTPITSFRVETIVGTQRRRLRR